MSQQQDKALPEEIAFILGSAVANRKDELVYLLQRNGVNVANNISDEQLIQAVFAANDKSERFRGELSTVLTQVVLEDEDGEYENYTDPTFAQPYITEGAEYANFGSAGLHEFEPLGSATIDEIPTTPASPTNVYQSVSTGGGGTRTRPPQVKRSFWDSLDPSTINNALNLGLSALGGVLSSRQQKKQLEQQAQLIAQQQQNQNKSGIQPQRPTVSPLLIGGIVAGVMVIGTVIYLVSRKKK